MNLLRISRAVLLLVAVVFPISASSQSIDEAIGSLAEKLGVQLGEEGTQRLAIHGFSDLNGLRRCPCRGAPDHCGYNADCVGEFSHGGPTRGS
jgi:hypothetical protein